MARDRATQPLCDLKSGSGKIAPTYIVAAMTSALTIQRSRQKARGYKHNAIVFLTNEQYYCRPAGKPRTPLIVEHIPCFILQSSYA